MWFITTRSVERLQLNAHLPTKYLINRTHILQSSQTKLRIITPAQQTSLIINQKLQFAVGLKTQLLQLKSRWSNFDLGVL